jgi:hypothetical protein
MSRPWPTGGCCAMVKNKRLYIKRFRDNSVSVITKQRSRRPENRDLITGNGKHFPSQQPGEVSYNFLLREQRRLPSRKQYLHGSYILRTVTFKHRGNFIFTCWPISPLPNTVSRENVFSLVLFISKLCDRVHVSYKSHVNKLAESSLDSGTLFPSFPERLIWRCCQLLSYIQWQMIESIWSVGGMLLTVENRRTLKTLVPITHCLP